MIGLIGWVGMVITHGVAPLQTPQVIPLWANGAPGFESRKSEAETQPHPWSIGNINNPSLTVYLPPKEKANGTAIVIAAGGGFSELVYGPEGVEPAQYLNNLGVTCFVLKYRLPREKNSPYKLDIHPLQDADRAMRVVRSRASEFGVDPNRVGILGFSAGGEVASVASYGPALGDPNAPDPIDRLNARPNFQMSIYPGPLGVPDVIPSDAPPTFMLVSNDDEGHVGVVVKMINEFRAAKVPFEAHILSQGGHGYNLGARSNLAAVKTWPQRMADWLSDNGWLKKG